jgi:predicted permease
VVVPLSGDAGGNDVWPEGNRNAAFNTLVNFVGPGYFDVLGVHVSAGREFDARDTPASPQVVIVNDTFAAKLGGAAAIGHHVTREATPGGPEQTFEIVGIVRNSAYTALKDDPYPTMYYAASQDGPSQAMRVLVRSALPPAATTAALTAEVANIDPRISVSYSVVADMIRDTFVQERVLAALSSVFGALAALLTMVGLYGLISYSVTRRSIEIGVRIALGATRRDIVRLVIRETGVLLCVGAAVGCALALAAGPAAATLLFHVKPYDPLALAGAVVALGVVALLASYLPARRAARIAPVVALRTD